MNGNLLPYAYNFSNSCPAWPYTSFSNNLQCSTDIEENLCQIAGTMEQRNNNLGYGIGAFLRKKIEGLGSTSHKMERFFYSYFDGNTELHHSIIRKDRLSIICTHLDSVHFENYHKETPLTLAAKIGNLDLVKLFISKGAKVDHQDSKGKTPLMHAIEGSFTKIINFLIHSKADVLLTDNQKNTCMHLAAASSNFGRIKNFLNLKIPLDFFNSDQLTPLTIAVQKGNTIGVRLLLEAGASPTIRNDKGLSSYDYARMGGNKIIIAIFTQNTLTIVPRINSPKNLATLALETIIQTIVENFDNIEPENLLNLIINTEPYPQSLSTFFFTHNPENLIKEVQWELIQVEKSDYEKFGKVLKSWKKFETDKIVKFLSREKEIIYHPKNEIDNSQLVSQDAKKFDSKNLEKTDLTSSIQLPENEIIKPKNLDHHVNLNLPNQPTYLETLSFEKFLENKGYVGIPKDLDTILGPIFAEYELPYYKHLKDLVSNRGINTNSGILLYGPPGTGKTFFVKSLVDYMSQEIEINFRSICGAEVFDKYMGETEKNIRKFFETHEDNTNLLTVLFIDEIDSIGQRKDDSESWHISPITQLLALLDGFKERKNLLVLAATNKLTLIDKALLRPGRFGDIITCNLPTLNDRRALFDVYLRPLVQQKVVHSDVNIETLSLLTENYSHAEIMGLTKKANQKAFLRALRLFEHKKADPKEVNRCVETHIKQSDFLEVIKKKNETKYSTADAK